MPRPDLPVLVADTAETPVQSPTDSNPVIARTVTGYDVNVYLVDTESRVRAFLRAVQHAACRHGQELWIEVGGRPVSCEERVGLMAVHVFSSDIYILDVHVLRNKAFDTPGARRRTFRQILQSPSVKKVFHDVRRASYALYFQHDIKLAGVIDLQLRDFATRPDPNGYFIDLSTHIDQLVARDEAKATMWARSRATGGRFLTPSNGRANDVWYHRPVPPEFLQFCAQRIALLPYVKEDIYSRVSYITNTVMESEELRRIEETLREGYRLGRFSDMLRPSEGLLKATGSQPRTTESDVSDRHRYEAMRPDSLGPARQIPTTPGHHETDDSYPSGPCSDMSARGLYIRGVLKMSSDCFAPDPAGNLGYPAHLVDPSAGSSSRANTAYTSYLDYDRPGGHQPPDYRARLDLVPRLGMSLPPASSASGFDFATEPRGAPILSLPPPVDYVPGGIDNFGTSPQSVGSPARENFGSSTSQTSSGLHQVPSTHFDPHLQLPPLVLPLTVATPSVVRPRSTSTSNPKFGAPPGPPTQFPVTSVPCVLKKPRSNIWG